MGYIISKGNREIRNCALFLLLSLTPFKIITLDSMINIYGETILFLYLLRIYLI